MPLQFRNVEADPNDPVEQWPTEAVRTALDRGHLPDWQKVSHAIRRDPWGKTARAVEECLAASRPYGVSEAFEQLIAQARDDAAREERLAVAEALRRLIVDSGLTQREFAERLGTSASRLSTYVNATVSPAATLMVRAERVCRPATIGRT